MKSLPLQFQFSSDIKTSPTAHNDMGLQKKKKGKKGIVTPGNVHGFVDFFLFAFSAFNPFVYGSLQLHEYRTKIKAYASLATGLCAFYGYSWHSGRCENCGKANSCILGFTKNNNKNSERGVFFFKPKCLVLNRFYVPKCVFQYPL